MPGELRVVRFSVKQLFGCLDHDIPLSDEGITFIHGPNGCGKTTVLRLLADTLACNLSTVARVPFHSLEVMFNDGVSLEIERKRPVEENISEIPAIAAPETRKTLNQFALEVRERRGSRILHIRGVESDDETKESELNYLRANPGLVTRNIKNLMRASSRHWRDRKSGELLTLEAVLQKYSDALPFTIPDWFRAKTSQVSSGFIRAQRLLHIEKKQPTQVDLFESDDDDDDEKPPSIDMVSIYSDSVKEMIAAVLGKSAVQSQARERSFPQRLLQGVSPSTNEITLREQYSQLEARLKNLAAAGLQEAAGNIDLPQRKLNPTERRVLALYLADLNEKLDVFRGLQAKIELLREIFGAKLRRKLFSIERENGFVFEDTSGGGRLTASDLSSGEQHQLVMLFQLVFSSADGQLFLIDEPEISLHIEWQRQFLSDLLKVAAVKNHVFLIATHSPQIISDRLDLAIPLDGGIAP